MTNSVKTMNNEGHGFQYLKQKFPNLSGAKLKQSIFIGPLNLFEHLKRF